MAIEPNTRGSDPADNATEITPSDSTDLTNTARSLYVGAGGDVKVTTANGDTVTFEEVQGGSILPVRVRRIFATGTTATSIVAIY